MPLGLDNIDLTYAKERGIAVYNTPDVVTNSTADLAFAIFLAFIRKIPEAQVFVREGKWKGWEPDLYLGEELSLKIFGIIGFGRIGRAIANYFAENFIINTNGRIVEATPPTYEEYLYKLKSKLNSVTYDVKELFEASNKVVTTFIIHMNFTEKETKSLLATSIFKFNERCRIIGWQEIFTDAKEHDSPYK